MSKAKGRSGVLRRDGYPQRDWFVLGLASQTCNAEHFPQENRAESEEHFEAPLRISCLKAA
jgi:hypothetical protein